MKMKKIKVKTNKSVYLGLSILEISRIMMYEFWYDCIKPKYQQNAKVCYWIQLVSSFILKFHHSY